MKQALLGLPEHVVRLCELLCAALKTSIRISNDADLISPLWDSVSRDIPSVEEHAQNQFHDGVLHLVGSLVGLLPALIAGDAGMARRMADEWRGLPSQIGTRLWLHAQRTNALFSIDEVMANVLSLGKEDFWARQRELIVLLVDRLPEAEPAQIDQLVERIGREGPALYLGEEYVRAGETDWRPSARDHDMWLRLLAIKRAEVLTEAGELLLAQIMARTSYLAADYDESDLFSTYSSGVRSVVGDSAPLLEAAPEERLEIAHKLQEGHQFGRHDDWRAYCGADPKGAFDSLSATGFRPEDAELWRSLIQSLAYPVPTEPPAQAVRDRLLKKVFAALQPASDEQLTPLLHPLTDCLQSRFKMPIGLRARWWDRLWALAAAVHAGEDEQDAEADGERFLGHVINAPAGKLAEDLLRLIEAEKNARGAASRPTMARARRMLADTSRAGHLARGIFARHAGYLAHIDEPFTVRHLVPWLRRNSARAVTLRAVLGQWSQLGARASKLLKAELIAAAIECRTSGLHAQHVVAKVLFPVVANKLNDERVDWGFEPRDARRVLKLGTEDLRSAAAACLSIWQAKIVDIEPEEAWVRGIRPTFEEAWPQESKYRNTEIAGQLALLAVRTGKHFPEALAVVRPYIVATGERWPGLHFLDDSEVPSTFPGETLDLLWLLLKRRRESVGSPGLANALDAIKAAKPELEIDRRFQWLETKALRFS